MLWWELIVDINFISIKAKCEYITYSLVCDILYKAPAPVPHGSRSEQCPPLTPHPHTSNIILGGTEPGKNVKNAGRKIMKNDQNMLVSAASAWHKSSEETGTQLTTTAIRRSARVLTSIILIVFRFVGVGFMAQEINKMRQCWWSFIVPSPPRKKEYSSPPASLHGMKGLERHSGQWSSG